MKMEIFTEENSFFNILQGILTLWFSTAHHHVSDNWNCLMSVYSQLWAASKLSLEAFQKMKLLRPCLDLGEEGFLYLWGGHQSSGSQWFSSETDAIRTPLRPSSPACSGSQVWHCLQWRRGRSRCLRSWPQLHEASCPPEAFFFWALKPERGRREAETLLGRCYVFKQVETREEKELLWLWPLAVAFRTLSLGLIYCTCGGTGGVTIRRCSFHSLEN